MVYVITVSEGGSFSLQLKLYSILHILGVSSSTNFAAIIAQYFGKHRTGYSKFDLWIYLCELGESW